MQLEYAKDPKWVNAEHTMIDLVVKWAEFREEMPFSAKVDDVEAHGRAVFAAAAAGEFGPVAEFIPPPEPEPTVAVAPMIGTIPNSVL